jgi:DNA-binding NarL/FixJ family response regulator
MKNTAKNKDQEDDPQQVVVDELKDIKGLLVLLLLKSGATQGEIAKALGTTQPTISKTYPLGDVDPILTRGK